MRNPWTVISTHRTPLPACACALGVLAMVCASLLTAAHHCGSSGVHLHAHTHGHGHSHGPTHSHGGKHCPEHGDADSHAHTASHPHGGTSRAYRSSRPHRPGRGGGPEAPVPAPHDHTPGDPCSLCRFASERVISELPALAVDRVFTALERSDLAPEARPLSASPRFLPPSRAPPVRG